MVILHNPRVFTTVLWVPMIYSSHLPLVESMIFEELPGVDFSELDAKAKRLEEVLKARWGRMETWKVQRNWYNLVRWKMV
jgi:hypothetical protein